MDEIAWGQNPGEKGRGPQSQPQAPPTPGGGGGPGRADGSPAAERGAGQQPQHQGRRSLSRAAQLVLPSPDHPGHGATSLRSLDGPFPPPETAEAPHGQRRRRGARAGCWLRGARGRSRGDLHMAHDCPPHSSTPVAGRGVKITVPAHIALALASQQTRLQELGLLAHGGEAQVVLHLFTLNVTAVQSGANFCSKSTVIIPVFSPLSYVALGTFKLFLSLLPVTADQQNRLLLGLPLDSKQEQR